MFRRDSLLCFSFFHLKNRYAENLIVPPLLVYTFIEIVIMYLTRDK